MNNSYEFEGRLKKIFPIFTRGTFMKQEFCLVTDEQHPQIIKFEVHQKNIHLLSTVFVGDVLSIKFNIRGISWYDETGKEKIIQSFVAWKVNKVENGYKTPVNERSPHPQHNYNLPPAEEVFGKVPEIDVYAFDASGNKINEPFKEEEQSDLPF